MRKTETKLILGVLHIRIRCIGCGEKMWVNVHYDRSKPQFCVDCSPEDSLHFVGNPHPSTPRSEETYEGD